MSMNCTHVAIPVRKGTGDRWHRVCGRICEKVRKRWGNNSGCGRERIYSNKAFCCIYQ